MGKYSEAKSARVLAIYARLLSGQTLRRTMLAQEYGVTERSILRDVRRCGPFYRSRGVLRPLSTTGKRAATAWRMRFPRA